MFFSLIEFAMSKLLFFALHLESSSFPKPLSKSEEEEYFRAYKNGDQNARRVLIEHNLRLVAHIVKKYYFSSTDQDDLISIGTIGLIKAVESFDFDKAPRFASYASRCIENEILMHFRSAKKAATEVFFSDPIDMDKDGNPLTLMDIIPSETSIIDSVDLKMKTEKLYGYIKDLEPRELTIIAMRYGLGNNPPLTQREISEKLNISRSYVSRIEKKALEKLRKRFK